MGRVGNCLQMLFILQSRNGGIVKLTDLAQRLEVSDRMIRSYKDDLEKAGIFIESTTGKHGGYRIAPGQYLKLPPLSEMERLALNESVSQLSASDAFVLEEDLRRAVEKILADQLPLGQPQGPAAPGSTAESGRVYIRDEQQAGEESQYRSIYLDFNAAIIERRKLEIRYYSNTSEVTARVIRPYGLVAYQSAWYCVAWCELRGQIRAFKLARVKHYQELEEHFSIPEDFNIKDHVGNSHLMRGTKLRLELRVDPPLANHVSERIWGQMQETIRLETGSVILRVDVEDTPELAAWILSLGKFAQVLAPKELRERLGQEIAAMMENSLDSQKKLTNP